MHYSVPQFIEIEDKIIGPFTLKQFLILVAGGLIILFFYSLFELGFIFLLLTLPTAGVFAMLAFGKFNGRPALVSVPAVLQFLLTPKIRILQRTGRDKALSLIKKIPFTKPGGQGGTSEEDQTMTPTSRLQRLAYFLDQKAAEEERLIHSGKL